MSKLSLDQLRGGVRARGYEREQVLIVDSLLAVGQFGESAVGGFDFRLTQTEAEFRVALRERVAARVLAQDDSIRRHADRLGRHYLVAERVRQHAVLVNPSLVREGVAADDGLVRLHVEADDFGERL